jgi:hypothetical protein
MENKMLDRLLDLNHSLSKIFDKWFADDYDPDDETEEEHLAEEAEYNELNTEYILLRKTILDALKSQEKNTQ